MSDKRALPGCHTTPNHLPQVRSSSHPEPAGVKEGHKAEGALGLAWCWAGSGQPGSMNGIFLLLQALLRSHQGGFRSSCPEARVGAAGPRLTSLPLH